MPVTTSQDSEDCSKNVSNNRRASLPHNMKIPTITVTPSSPSPDPDHPDYPEFFEAQIFKESMNSVESLAYGTKEPIENSSTEKSDADVIMLETSASDEKSTSDLESGRSTPDIDEVYAFCKNDEERRRVLRFRERENLGKN